jgi:hypothetical protein
MRLVFEQRIVERLFKEPYFNRTVCATVSTAAFRRLRVDRIRNAGWWGITGTACQLAEFAAVAGDEDGVCGGTWLDRMPDRVSLPRAATLRPGFCGRTGRPGPRSNPAKNASEPKGRPLPSAVRSAAKASGSVLHSALHYE